MTDSVCSKSPGALSHQHTCIPGVKEIKTVIGSQGKTAGPNWIWDKGDKKEYLLKDGKDTTAKECLGLVMNDDKCTKDYLTWNKISKQCSCKTTCGKLVLQSFNPSKSKDSAVYKIRDDVQCSGSPCRVLFYRDSDCSRSGTAHASKSMPWAGPYEKELAPGRGDYNSNSKEFREDLDDYESVEIRGSCASVEFMDEDEGFSPGASDNAKVEFAADGHVVANNADAKNIGADKYNRRGAFQCIELHYDLKNDLSGIKIVTSR